MQLKQIALENFRNIKKEEIKLFNGVNVFYGDNAQGKTNVIESIWLFSAMKSFRGAKDIDFIKKGEKSAEISCIFEKGGRDINAKMKFYPEKRREIFKNGVKIKTAEMIGNVNTVLFYPEHLSLIKEGPEIRRKFLDTAISQIKPNFYSVLAEYNKVLAQRNFLLKSENKDIQKTVSVWDRKLSYLSGIITNTRKTYLEKIMKLSEKTVDEISSGKEKISHIYSSCGKEEITSSKEEENAVYEKLKESFSEDLRLGYTSFGCHRDDFTLYINENSAKIYGSQGQQRSVIMALKLAEADMIYEYNDEYPVMLFDDIFSELDGLRKAYITENIKDRQVVVTTCEKIDFFDGANYIKVENGKAVT